MPNPTLLSKHSSNPLQAPSDDPANKKYLAELAPVLAREKNRGDRDTSSVHDRAEQEEDLLLESGDDEEDNDGADDTMRAGRGDANDEEDDDEHLASDEEEENTLFLKEPQEQAQILGEIQDLEKTVPNLKKHYKVIDRLGEGTFSSVYKAIDISHHFKWDNIPWQGHHPTDSSAHFQSAPYPPHSKVFVAIKRIYVTSSPSRIMNEIALMEDCRGCRHVAQLITAFREKDQVVAIMPFHRNVDFRQYFTTIPLSSLQSYFKCLLRGLRDIHARDIVHRDIKPANFLFDPDTGQGMIVDFGLAQKIEEVEETSCNHTPPTRHFPHGHLKSFSRQDMQRMRETLADSRKKSAGPSDRVGWLADETRHSIKANRAGTRGFRAPEVLLKCEDQTAALDIWSAGTILLSCLSGKFPIFNANDDTEALMEIAAILGKKKMENCAQLHNRSFITNVPSVDHAGIPWREVAERLNPSLVSDAADSSDDNQSEPEYQRSTDPFLPLAFDLLEGMLNPDMTKRITARDALYHPFLVERMSPFEPQQEMYDDIILDHDVETREYTDPETGESVVAGGDDLYVPHPFGEGVCRKGHWIDDETGDHCCFAIVAQEFKPKKPAKPKKSGSPDEKQKRREERAALRAAKERELGIFTLDLDNNEGGGEGKPMQLKVRLRKLMAGEGIAIGLEPCEFHKNGVIDASYWHTRLKPLMMEAVEEGADWNGDDGDMDEDAA